MEIDSQELIYDELKINVKNKGDTLSLINSNKNGNIILKSGNEGYLRVVGGRDTSTNNGIYFEVKDDYYDTIKEFNNKNTAIIALVLCVIASRNLETSRQKYSSSISTNIGIPP